jgi:TadE-like protein
MAMAHNKLLNKVTAKLRRLRDLQSGVATLEFAFAAPIFLSLMTLAVEGSYQAVIRTALEATLSAAARESITGNISEEMRLLNLTREEVLKKRVNDKMVLFKAVKLSTVAGEENPKFRLIPTQSIQNGGGFTNVGRGEPLEDFNGNGLCDTGFVSSVSNPTNMLRETFQDSNGNSVYEGPNVSTGLGGPGDIVQYQVTLKSPLFFSAFKVANNNKSDLEMISTVVLQNESYASAQANNNIRKYCDGSAA